MSRFLAEQFLDMQPYTPGEQPQDKKYIKLNTNESPFAPSKSVKKALDKKQVENLRLYSDPEAKMLVKAIAKRYNLKKENIIATNGSDEVLAFAFLAFGGTKKIAYPDISYGFYSVFANLFSLQTNEVPITDSFCINPDDYLQKGENVVIANPNAPTGIALSIVDIEKILKAHKKDIVIIDEAYVDFGGESCVPLLKKYDNLLVVQTFSKSRNLAGARLGFGMASKEIIEDLNKIKFSFNPYNVNRLTMLAGTKAIEDEKYFAQCIQKIVAVRDNTKTELEKRGFAVLDSKTNFLFAKSDKISGEQLYKQLKENGILVRWFSKIRIQDFVRITIGTDKQMQAFIKAIDKIFKTI